MDINAILVKYPWKNVKNVADPEIVRDDFAVDNGYFNEENNADDWSIENGVLHTEAKGKEALTYVHVFEKNVSFKARIRINETFSDDASFSMMLRYNAADAWVKLVHTPANKMWYILSRSGADFHPIRYRVFYDTPPVQFCDKYMALEAGKWYDISFTLDGDTAKVGINDEEFFENYGIEHVSPGRIGFTANDMSVDIDNVEITLLSGQGTVWKNVKHTKLPDEKYREGGSVFEMKDGSLIYTHHSGATFESQDNGASWERRELWTDTYGYVNILRLKNGDFMKMGRCTEDGKNYVISFTSSDDGKSWTPGGKLLRTPYRGDTYAHAGNMNDKITQISTGRIFYSQNYEVSKKEFPVDGKYIVFCEFYYSDDNGMTWTKSETDSWDLPGNEEQAWFGECKILECSDGTLRMYNSWNDHGCVVYSESKDMGVTWGPLTPIPELICARSSMQFYRDPYAVNETTYYMVWVYSEPWSMSSPMTRSRLSLAKSTDGKNWEFLGDLWRWEHPYCSISQIAHVVDAFIKTTKDYIICGAGYSEQLEIAEAGDYHYHHAQRQHIYSIRKDTLPEGGPIPLP